MCDVIGVEEIKKMVKGAIEEIRKVHPFLSELDSATGDGDHGTSMLRGMNNLAKILAETPAADLKTLLHELGWSFLGVDGGATGPLMGSFFMGMSEAVGEKQSLDCQAFANMFEGGLASIRKQTKAQVGDKTLIDALVPAVQALREGAAAGLGIRAALPQAVAAAEKGAAATKEFRARFGRAKNLGERVLGHQDAGATSMAFIFRGFLEGLSI